MIDRLVIGILSVAISQAMATDCRGQFAVALCKSRQEPIGDWLETMSGHDSTDPVALTEQYTSAILTALRVGDIPTLSPFPSP